MMRWTPPLALAALLLGTAGGSGCNGMTKLFPTASSAGGEGGLLPPGLTASIVYERSRNPRDPGALARFTAKIAGVPLQGVSLLLPDGSTLSLGRADRADLTRWEVGIEASEAAILERFPNGSYTFDIALESGARRTLTVFVSGSFPDFADIFEPLDGATGVPIDERFIWAGPEVRYDVAVVNEATGERQLVADDIEGFEAIPSAPLAPATGYRLELAAETGPPGELVEFESVTIARFETAGE